MKVTDPMVMCNSTLEEYCSYNKKYVPKNWTPSYRELRSKLYTSSLNIISAKMMSSRHCCQTLHYIIFHLKNLTFKLNLNDLTKLIVYSTCHMVAYIFKHSFILLFFMDLNRNKYVHSGVEHHADSGNLAFLVF